MLQNGLYIDLSGLSLAKESTNPGYDRFFIFFYFFRCSINGGGTVFAV